MKQIFETDVRYICKCKHTDDIRRAVPRTYFVVMYCSMRVTMMDADCKLCRWRLGMHRQMFKRGTGE